MLREKSEGAGSSQPGVIAMILRTLKQHMPGVRSGIWCTLLPLPALVRRISKSSEGLLVQQHKFDALQRRLPTAAHAVQRVESRGGRAAERRKGERRKGGKRAAGFRGGEKGRIK